MFRVAEAKVSAKFLAPYLAVAVFWNGLSNAWLSMLAYHALILVFSRESWTRVRRPVRGRELAAALPAVIAGPAVFLLLPYASRADLSAWLANHHLSGASFAALVPYFGLVHPVLEQVHWSPLRERTPVAHPIFAGYHLLVLGSLLSVSWLLVSFAFLTTASFLWHRIERRTGSLAVPIVSQVLADAGIVVAAWCRS